jgi:hypothetical protein
METIEGFEGPYSIELLSSTHRVATDEKCASPREAWPRNQKMDRSQESTVRRKPCDGSLEIAGALRLDSNLNDHPVIRVHAWSDL